MKGLRNFSVIAGFPFLAGRYSGIQLYAVFGNLNESVSDRRTDQRKNPMDGQNLLSRCENASKKDVRSDEKGENLICILRQIIRELIAHAVRFL